MGKALATTVILVDENGQPKVFNAGDVPAKKYADQIDNPKAWAEVDGDEPQADPEPEEVDDDPAPDADPDPEDEDDDVAPPPAKNAAKDVWVEYAQSRGIELGDDASKKDYQDAVDAL